MKTKIKAPTKKFKKSAKKKLTVTLKSASGKKLASKKIIVKINKKTYKAKTNKKGQATIKIKLKKKGSFKYSATFKGDKYYYKTAKNGKVKII